MRIRYLILSFSILCGSYPVFAMQQNTITIPVQQEDLQLLSPDLFGAITIGMTIALTFVTHFSYPSQGQQEIEIDLLRGVEHESIIVKAKRLMQELRARCKCSEDYAPRVDPLLLGISSFLKALKERNLGALQNRLAHSIHRVVFDRLIYNFALQNPGSMLHRLALESSTVSLLEHGECGNLSAELTIAFMKAHFPKIRRVYIEAEGPRDLKADHEFNIIEDENGVSYAADPFFFEDVMPLEQFYTSQKVLSYFRVLIEDPSWTFQEETRVTVYEGGDYAHELDAIAEQIAKLLDASSNDIEIQKMRDQVLKIQNAQTIEDVEDLIIDWLFGDNGHDLTKVHKWQRRLSSSLKTLLSSLTRIIWPDEQWVIDLEHNVAYLPLPRSEKTKCLGFVLFSLTGIPFECHESDDGCYFLVLCEIKETRVMKTILRYMVPRLV